MNATLLTGLLALSIPAADDSLRDAITRGDLDKVQQYIEAHADLNRLVTVPFPGSEQQKLFVMTEGELMLRQRAMEHNAHIELPLTLAITLGKKDVAALLIRAGADPGKPMTNGRTAVHVAVRMQDDATLKLLIERKAPLDVHDQRGATPLMMALDKPPRESAKLLLKAGADPNKADQQGKTILHYAAEYGFEEMAELLLRHKGDPNRPDVEGRTPLQWAVVHNRREVAEKMLAAGANADVIDAHGETPLITALARDDYDLAQGLIDAGARIDRRDKQGRGPLHHLVPYPGAVRFLLARKADAGAKDDNGRTPLHAAVSLGPNWARCPESIVTLLRHGADPTAEDDQGRTPFDVARDAKAYGTCRVFALHMKKPPALDALKLWPADDPQHKRYLEVKKGLDDGTLKPDDLLGQAVSMHQFALVELLISRKADVNLRVKDKPSPLYCAALGDSWLAAKLLLDAGAKPADEKGAFGALLIYVVERGNVELARLLLEHGADPNVTWSHRSDENMTPLLLAVKQGDLGMVDLLLGHKAKVNVRGWFHHTPLASVAYMNKRRLVLDRLLAVKGLDLNPGDGSDVTLLHHAAEKGDVKLMKRLLDLGANIDALERKEYTPLFWAVSRNQPEAARFLVEKGARVSWQVTRDGRTYDSTLLHTAAAVWKASPETVELLLKKGADVNGRDQHGRTPLHFAAENFGNAEVIRLLLKNGADVNARQEHLNKGATALYYASLHGHAEAVKALLDGGADTTLTSESDSTPLYAAACHGSTAVVKLLLEKGANPNVATPGYLDTPLHRAADSDKAEMVSLLLKSKADVKARDSMGRTPLDLAKGRGVPEIIDLLSR